MPPPVRMEFRVASCIIAYLGINSARLLPFCQAEAGKKIFAWLIAAPAIYAAGARAYRIVSCNDGESFENARGSACA
jgi:hypothetical protein